MRQASKRFPLSPRQRSFQRNLIVIVGLAGLLCFWGMDGAQSQHPWMSVPPQTLAGLRTESPALEPDAMALSPLPEAKEDEQLRAALEAVIERAPSNLTPHLYFLDLKTGAYVNLSGSTPVPAASVIKLPILLEYFRKMAADGIRPDEELAYDFIHQAGGSGELQYTPPGFKIKSLDVATQMIQISDNSATNIFIDRLGGMNELDDRFKRMGLRETDVNNWLPDLTGTNTISNKDMATVLYNISHTPYLSKKCQACKDEALRILEGTHNRRLIPAALPPGTKVAHKTGDIGTSIGDSALVTLADRREYLLSIQVERPYNDGGAKPLLVELSRTVYNHVLSTSQPEVANNDAASKVVTPQ